MTDKTRKTNVNAILLAILLFAPFLIYTGMKLEHAAVSITALALFITTTVVMLIRG